MGSRLLPALRDRKILAALAEIDGGFSYLGFDALARRTGLDRRQVRVDVRRLARYGLTQFGKGLWDEDGEPAGSGYAITAKGREIYVKMVEDLGPGYNPERDCN